MYVHESLPGDFIEGNELKCPKLVIASIVTTKENVKFIVIYYLCVGTGNLYTKEVRISTNTTWTPVVRRIA